MAVSDYSKLLPLSEATYYILVALDQPAHGYSIMQKVEVISEGTVAIGPGTLYGAFSTLEKQGLIAMVKEEARRKSYALTARGRDVLAEQVRRLQIMVRNGTHAGTHASTHAGAHAVPLSNKAEAA